MILKNILNQGSTGYEVKKIIYISVLVITIIGAKYEYKKK